MTKEELLKIYSAYLPHKTKIGFEGDELIHDFVGLDTTNEGVQLISPFGDFGRSNIESCKPVLYSMDILTKPITHNGETFVPFDRIEIYKGSGVNYLLTQIYSGMVEKIVWDILLEWHFNIFNLPETEFIKKESL